MPRYFYPNPRNVTSNTKKISIFWLNQNKLIRSGVLIPNNLQWSNSSTKEKCGDIDVIINTLNETDAYIRFSYKSRTFQDNDWRSMDYRFNLLKIPCNFGGCRWYFECGLVVNGKYCGRRIAILYSVGNYFGCRHCANLSYESCNENKKSRYGYFRVLTKSWKADDYYLTLKRKTYRGKPTRKYRRYLKLSEYTDEEILDAEKSIFKFEADLKNICK